MDIVPYLAVAHAYLAEEHAFLAEEEEEAAAYQAAAVVDRDSYRVEAVVVVVAPSPVVAPFPGEDYCCCWTCRKMCVCVLWVRV